MEAVVFAWFQQASDTVGRCSADQLDCSNKQVMGQTMPLYLALFLFAGVYQVLVSLWALSYRNTIQLGFLMIFSLAMLVYSGIQYDQIRVFIGNQFTSGAFLSDRQVLNFLISVPCILGGQFLFQMFLTWKLYEEFNWDIFKRIGASLRLKRALRDYLFFESIVIFDIFFFVGFTLQFVIVVLQTKDVEFGLTIAVIPLTILVLLAAIYSAKREFKPGLYAFVFVCFPGMAYFLFKLIRLYTVGNPIKKNRFMRARKTLTVFAVVTLVFLVLTIIYSIKVLRNFGLGLKKESERKDETLHETDSIPLGSKDSNGNEMIDTRIVID